MENACQFKIVKETLLKNGYVSRNDILKQHILETAKYIKDLREDYVIDTIHYKPKTRWYNWSKYGNCIYLLKNKKGEEINKNYKRLLKYFIETNTLRSTKKLFFTNDIQNR